MQPVRRLLIVQHVPWEGPHVILDSFTDVPVLVRNTFHGLRRMPLPDPMSIRGAIIHGGPMTVNDTECRAPLADEIAGCIAR